MTVITTGGRRSSSVTSTNSSKILCLMFVYVLFYVNLCRDWFLLLLLKICGLVTCVQRRSPQTVAHIANRKAYGQFRQIFRLSIFKPVCRCSDCLSSNLYFTQVYVQIVYRQTKGQLRQMSRSSIFKPVVITGICPDRSLYCQTKGQLWYMARSSIFKPAVGWDGCPDCPS